MRRERAIVFIDGNNWFHGLEKKGVDRRLALNYAKISEKLVLYRDWIATRYYIGQVDQRQGAGVYANQRRFVSKLQQADARISVHFGRIEPRVQRDDAAKELVAYLANLKQKIDPVVYKALLEIGKRHAQITVWKEKAVDVMLAVDMVVMAIDNKYDVAYILSADGDYTSAVDYVRQSLHKKVFAASPLRGAKLADRVNSFISLQRAWFADCYD